MKSAYKLIIAIAVCEFAGILGSLFTFSAIPTWYAGLAKPVLNPPSWLFGPVWTALYALMGVAWWLVWRSAADPAAKRRAHILFILQLTLNAAWSPIFFGLHSIGWAFGEILVLWILIIFTLWTFAKISRLAAWLLVPYILWVSFAAYLNYSIWMLN